MFYYKRILAKIYLKLVIVFLPFLFHHSAQAQQQDTPKKYPLLTYGLKAGFNIATFRGVEVKNASTQIGFTGGPFLNTQFNKKFSLLNEIFYTQKSASALYTIIQNGDTLGDSYQTTIRNDARLIFKCVDVSAYGKYHFVSKRDYSTYVLFGPVFSFIPEVQISGTTDIFISDLTILDAFFGEGSKLLIQSYDLKPEESGLDFNKYDYGLTIGGGTTYALNWGSLTFDMRYTFGLPDVDRSPTTRLHTGQFVCLLGVEF